MRHVRLKAQGFGILIYALVLVAGASFGLGLAVGFIWRCARFGFELVV